MIDKNGILGRESRMLSGALLLGAVLFMGCGSGAQKDKTFFTSGSREADQRADQRMAKSNQLKGEAAADPAGHSTAKRPLYEKLGEEQGIKAIVEDFVPRVLADPRVNFQRKGIKRGGLSIHHFQSIEWSATAANVSQLKIHLAQFLALATGGPAKYAGRPMAQVHAGMQISNPEFDAAIGDMKATLDKLQINTQDQKELLSIIESSRPEIVEQR